MDIPLYLSKAGLYWNTLRYLRLVQIIGRIKRQFHKPQVRLDVTGERSKMSGVWHSPAQRALRMVDEYTFCFLNKPHSILSSADWNNPQWEKLWLYNLHYFDDLTAVEAECRSGWHQKLIQRWIEENPPVVGNGWEAYPISLRIVNWIKWELAGNELKDDWLNSLAVQTEWLAQNLENHILGNHLFANAKALIYAGIFFQGKQSEGWYQLGRSIVVRELSEQVLEDGGNFELSTMYHLIFLEDLLDLVNIHRAYGCEQQRSLENTIPQMIHWMKIMCHPDGEISFFNDAALGITPSVTEIMAYAKRLGFCSADDLLLEAGFVDLHKSGYSRAEIEDAVLLVDRAAIGPDYLPAHAHADSLSFELSLFDQRVVVNSGTSVYGSGIQREKERGTAVHSTVVIDDEDSSEIWSGFRVARRARVKNRHHYKKEKGWVLAVSHDGYRRLPGKPIHNREWRLGKRQLIIRDSITGNGNHHVASILPLHPQVFIMSKQGSKVILDVDCHSVDIAIEGQGVLELRSSHYHPEFGCSVDNYQLVYSVQQSLPIQIITRISW